MKVNYIKYKKSVQAFSTNASGRRQEIKFEDKRTDSSNVKIMQKVGQLLSDGEATIIAYTIAGVSAIIASIIATYKCCCRRPPEATSPEATSPEATSPEATSQAAQAKAIQEVPVPIIQAKAIQAAAIITRCEELSGLSASISNKEESVTFYKKLLTLIDELEKEKIDGIATELATMKGNLNMLIDKKTNLPANDQLKFKTILGSVSSIKSSLL